MPQLLREPVVAEFGSRATAQLPGKNRRVSAGEPFMLRRLRDQVEQFSVGIAVERVEAHRLERTRRVGEVRFEEGHASIFSHRTHIRKYKIFEGTRLCRKG